MKGLVVLDLDETLISTVKRQYEVIHYFMEKNNYNFIDEIEYLATRKKTHLSNGEIVKSFIDDSDCFNRYKAFYLKNIERERYLRFDTLIVDPFLLSQINQNYDLILLSLRSNADNSNNQLSILGINHFFSEIYFVKHSESKNPKIDIVSEILKKSNVQYYIGDSLIDYEAADRNNIEFLHVKTSIYEVDFPTKSYGNINEVLKELIYE